ncbi:unnamed protein product [Mortierella alpina]
MTLLSYNSNHSKLKHHSQPTQHDEQNTVTLFCLVDGEILSRAFSVQIQPVDSVDDLKEIIKAKKAHDFSNIDANSLTLWKVSLSLPDDDDANSLTLWKVSLSLPVDEEETPITLDALSEKKKLPPTYRLSKLSVEPPLEDTIHIIVQHPSPHPSVLDPEIAALRKQLPDVFDSSFSK